jgi:hypothetical protein
MKTFNISCTQTLGILKNSIKMKSTLNFFIDFCAPLKQKRGAREITAPGEQNEQVFPSSPL